LGLGAFRFVVEIMVKTGSIEGGALGYVATVNFLHYAVFLFAVCSAVLVGVSLMTEAPSRAKLEHLCFAGIDRTAPVAAKRNGINAALTVVLIIVLGVLWWTFR
jgi:SSS family solute:Na+ symporter